MMNKLIIKEDIIKEQILDDSISVSFIKKDNFFSVNKIKIDVLKNSKLEIFHDTYEDIKIIGYKSYPAIKMPLNVGL